MSIHGTVTTRFLIVNINVYLLTRYKKKQFTISIKSTIMRIFYVILKTPNTNN